MCIAEATSARTLQLLSGMFEKTAIQTRDLPLVGKSHDDALLRPANETIGERPCLNESRCLAQFIAKMRYGQNTKMAFTCTEFLLPSERAAFLNGKGLPQRRSKCLLCTRYFINYIYILARTDPTFKAGITSLGLQVFSNPVAPGATAAYMDNESEELMREDAANLPTHCSIVSAKDGYRPEAMLFVDELFANMRSARETSLGTLLWRPVVRFCSCHYKYVLDDEGPRIIQVDIGASDAKQHFGEPPSQAGPAEA